MLLKNKQCKVGKTVSRPLHPTSTQRRHLLHLTHLLTEWTLSSHWKVFIFSLFLGSISLHTFMAVFFVPLCLKCIHRAAVEVLIEHCKENHHQGLKRWQQTNKKQWLWDSSNENFPRCIFLVTEFPSGGKLALHWNKSLHTALAWGDGSHEYTTQCSHR